MACLLSVEEARRVAAEVAAKFGIFECGRCAAEIAKRLGKDFPATFERLRTSDKSDVIGLAREDTQISTNRTHAGVRVGDVVFDNVHADGVAEREWDARFVSATGAPLERETRPIRDFFGKRFLSRKFTAWLIRA